MRSMRSEGPAALVGATTPVPEGGYVSDPTAWHSLSRARRAQFEQELQRSAGALNPATCVQTTSALRVGVRAGMDPGSPAPAPAATAAPAPAPAAAPAAASLVGDVSAGSLPAGCHAGAHGTTRCDTLFGFGAGSTPFTVTGEVQYSGTPVCITYGSGQLCTGWFGAWGADGTTNTGATGSGIGASTLAVAGVGNVRAQVTSSPSALYFSRAPSGDQTSVTVTPYVTLLDVTVQTSPDSTQCAPTKITYGVVTPNISTPALSGQDLVSCVAAVGFDGRTDAASQSSAAYQALRSTQLGLVSESGAGHAVIELVAAASAVHNALAATSHAGLFAAGSPPVGSGTVLAAACPALNDALAPGTKDADAFACTQSSIMPWKDVVLGQSLVSAQLNASAAVVASSGAGEAHLLMAFDTVEVHECWPAASCS